jgi:hypothetical protein
LVEKMLLAKVDMVEGTAKYQYRSSQTSAAGARSAGGSHDGYTYDSRCPLSILAAMLQTCSFFYSLVDAATTACPE